MTLLLVKLLGLLSGLGGPLYLFDLLDPGRWRVAVFALVYAPVAAMVIGVLTVLEDEPTRLACASYLLTSLTRRFLAGSAVSSAP